MTCLNERNFYSTYDDYRQIATDLGYETISDMLYIMYEEERIPALKIAKNLGFSHNSLKAKLYIVAGKRKVGNQRSRQATLSDTEVLKIIWNKSRGISYLKSLRILGKEKHYGLLFHRIKQLGA